MSPDESRRTASEVIRRNWLVVAACVLAAVAVAVVASLGATTTYEGRAVIGVDAVSVAQNVRLPNPDKLITFVRSGTLVDQLSEEFELGEDEVLDGINAFSLGNPQDRVVITFTSEQEAEAEDVTRAAAIATVDYGYELADPFISLQRQLVDDAASTLEAIEPLVDDSPAQRYPVWNVRRLLYTDLYNLTFAETMFSYDDGVSVTAQTRLSVITRAAIGGLIVGLALAIVLVAIREVWIRKRA